MKLLSDQTDLVETLDFIKFQTDKTNKQFIQFENHMNEGFQKVIQLILTQQNQNENILAQIQKIQFNQKIIQNELQKSNFESINVNSRTSFGINHQISKNKSQNLFSNQNQLKKKISSNNENHMKKNDQFFYQSRSEISLLRDEFENKIDLNFQPFKRVNDSNSFDPNLLKMKDEFETPKNMIKDKMHPPKIKSRSSLIFKNKSNRNNFVHQHKRRKRTQKIKENKKNAMLSKLGQIEFIFNDIDSHQNQSINKNNQSHFLDEISRSISLTSQISDKPSNPNKNTIFLISSHNKSVTNSQTNQKQSITSINKKKVPSLHFDSSMYESDKLNNKKQSIANSVSSNKTVHKDSSKKMIFQRSLNGPRSIPPLEDVSLFSINKTHVDLSINNHEFDFMGSRKNDMNLHSKSFQSKFRDNLKALKFDESSYDLSCDYNMKRKKESSLVEKNTQFNMTPNLVNKKKPVFPNLSYHLVSKKMEDEINSKKQNFKLQFQHLDHINIHPDSYNLSSLSNRFQSFEPDLVNEKNQDVYNCSIGYDNGDIMSSFNDKKPINKFNASKKGPLREFKYSMEQHKQSMESDDHSQNKLNHKFSKLNNEFDMNVLDQLDFREDSNLNTNSNINTMNELSTIDDFSHRDVLQELRSKLDAAHYSLFDSKFDSKFKELEQKMDEFNALEKDIHYVYQQSLSNSTFSISEIKKNLKKRNKIISIEKISPSITTKLYELLEDTRTRDLSDGLKQLMQNPSGFNSFLIKVKQKLSENSDHFTQLFN